MERAFQHCKLEGKCLRREVVHCNGISVSYLLENQYLDPQKCATKWPRTSKMDLEARGSGPKLEVSRLCDASARVGRSSRKSVEAAPRDMYISVSIYTYLYIYIYIYIHVHIYIYTQTFSPFLNMLHVLYVLYTTHICTYT